MYQSQLTPMLLFARENGYAVGSFSPRNTYLVKAVLDAAQAMQSPVIVQMSANEFRWFSVTAKEVAERFYSLIGDYQVQALLHLDHTKDMDTIKQAVDAGFHSVMIDASHEQFEENVRQTALVCEYAHAFNVSVEAELGRIGATDKLETDDDAILYTDPSQAREFVRLTQVDALAVSIGSAHGVYPVKNPKIDFDRLKEIRKQVDVPLVLHGGSGLPYQTVRRAIVEGICKVNIATDLEQAFLPAIGHESRLSNMQVLQLPEAVLEKGAQAVQSVVKEKIRDFVMSAGKQDGHALK